MKDWGERTLIATPVVPLVLFLHSEKTLAPEYFHGSREEILSALLAQPYRHADFMQFTFSFCSLMLCMDHSVPVDYPARGTLLSMSCRVVGGAGMVVSLDAFRSRRWRI